MWSLVASLALAQSVSAVPPGARAVTVMVCDTPDGCEPAFAAMSDHATTLGVPLLDFDAVALAGPAGGDARAALDEARADAATRPDPERLEAVRAAWRDTPLTLPGEELFDVWMRLAALRIEAGDAAGGEEALAHAVSVSAARVWDLPDLPLPVLDRYLALAERRDPPGRLAVVADVAPGGVAGGGALVFVDGRLVGHAPAVAEVTPGWHRVSVERAGRRTAWVGEVRVGSGRELTVRAELSADDAPAVLEQALAAAIRGAPPPPDVAARLAEWGADQGLASIRFVALSRPGQGGPTPEEHIDGTYGAWEVHATWLDVSSRRFDARGPGPARLRAAAAPDRFSLGAGLGYTRLQQSTVSGPDPHDQLDVELFALARLTPALTLDARVGLWRSAQPWYLYEGWLAHDVVTAAGGVRWTPGEGRAWLGAQALVVVPVAVGGQLTAGWAWRPSPRWRVGFEARGGWTDRGPVVGGGVVAWLSG